MTLRVVELFSGIGAQRMALTLAGIPHEVVAIAEINKHALASYEAIWGDCPNLGDITKVGRLPDCDLVTYSFPCQDLSLAGKRKGMGEGTRSGLVWEVVRLLESAERERPEWLLMENVQQVLTAPEWPSLVGRLEAMGYRNRWAKLDSSNFGSAQKRVRAFMVSRLGQDPPDLPMSAPNAPRLCLRDVMERERNERYTRRIPLYLVKWRTSKAEAGVSTPIASIDGETYYPNAMLYSSSSSSPTVTLGAGRHGISCGIKVVADWDKETLREENRRFYDMDGASPSVEAHMAKDGQGRIKILADWQRKGRIEQANRLYSANCACPTMVGMGGGNRDVKIVDQEDGDDLVVSILTPRECWRLMGFPEWAYLRASRVSSETQLYNQAGNSIVVEVLMAIFNSMFRPPKRRVQTTLEAVA